MVKLLVHGTPKSYPQKKRKHELTMVGGSTVRVGSTGGVVIVSLAVGSGRHLEEFDWY